ncbi:hypothetical protein [Phenylobacterium sp.]|uniref:hypothetical protein n=1 Tax=Phenylobacterium sp. TaxID=1871053 RepID=UPI00281228EB|nr:hypothetical protein [Phenylobacterium sp.]
MHTIRVSPADAWWAVRTDVFDNEMIFRSGGRAEEAARRLAMSLARAGHVVKLEVKARDGTTAGRFLCPPAPDPAPAPLEPALTVA